MIHPPSFLGGQWFLESMYPQRFVVMDFNYFVDLIFGGKKMVMKVENFEYPGEVISEGYELEYGNDCIEMHVGAVEPGERVLIIDDVVATGGTLSAAIRLLGN